MERYTHKQSIAFEPDMVDKIDDLKDRFGLKFSEVVRECIEFDLPRLINRHTQAKKRGQGRYRTPRKTKQRKA